MLNAFEITTCVAGIQRGGRKSVPTAMPSRFAVELSFLCPFERESRRL